MRLLTPCRLWFLVLGLPLACGSAENDLKGTPGSEGGFDDLLSADEAANATGVLKAGQVAFPGAGTSGAARPLTASLAPDTSSACDPEPSVTVPVTSADVQTVCFFGADSADVPAAAIEQVVEVVGTAEWVHIRLTLNPDFVDNTYGDTAIGWDRDESAGPGAPPGAAPPNPVGAPDAGAAPDPADAPPAPPEGAAPPDPADAPPAPPEGAAPPDPADAPPAPPGGAAPPDRAGADPAGAPPADPAGGRPPRGEARPRPGKGGHTFQDLLGSDHAELQLLDANGAVSMHFKLDYISESDEAASGYASLGVSGGEGKLIVGEPEWVLATATSIERNLEACGLGSFTENSPATDAAYTPNADASDWDYRVAYEIWVASDAFGSAGFGSALIENVHASPSKLEGNTVDVVPAPCPTDPGVPGAEPEPVPVVLQNIR
jgi:hypothetical protein